LRKIVELFGSEALRRRISEIEYEEEAHLVDVNQIERAEPPR